MGPRPVTCDLGPATLDRDQRPTCYNRISCATVAAGGARSCIGYRNRDEGVSSATEGRERRAGDRSAESAQPYLSLVVPAYNEGARLGETLRTIVGYLDRQPYRWELIVVDDGSTDDTLELATAFAGRDPRVVAVANPHRGKAYTVRSGVARARGKVIGFTDADLATPIDSLDRALPLLADGTDVVIGSREGKGAVRRDEPFYRHLMGRVFNGLVQLLALPGIQDTQCGFKILRGPVARELFGALLLYRDDAPPPQGPAVTAFDVELLYLARRRGYRIAAMPVVWQYIAESKVDPLKDSVRNLRDLLAVRLNALRGRYR